MKKVIFTSLFISNIILILPASARFQRIFEICEIALEGRNKAHAIHVQTSRNVTFLEETENVQRTGREFSQILYEGSGFFVKKNDQVNFDKVAKYITRAKAAAEWEVEILKKSIGGLKLSNFWYEQFLSLWKKIITVCTRKDEELTESLSTDRITKVETDVLEARKEIRQRKKREQQKQDRAIRGRSMPALESYQQVLTANASSPLPIAVSSQLQIQSDQSQTKKPSRKRSTSAVFSHGKTIRRGSERDSPGTPPKPPIRSDLHKVAFDGTQSLPVVQNGCKDLRKKCLTMEVSSLASDNQNPPNRNTGSRPEIPNRSDKKGENRSYLERMRTGNGLPLGHRLAKTVSFDIGTPF